MLSEMLVCWTSLQYVFYVVYKPNILLLLRVFEENIININDFRYKQSNLLSLVYMFIVLCMLYQELLNMYNYMVSGQIPPGQIPPGQIPPDKYPRTYTHHSKEIIQYRKIKVHFFKKNIYFYIYIHIINILHSKYYL